MSKADEISIKIAQAVEKANSACIYSNISKCISKVLCELRDCVCDFPNDGHSEELDTILLQLTKLCNILDSFKHDNLLQASIQIITVEDLLTHLKEIMELITSTLEKINVKLTSKYDPSIDNIYNDLSTLYEKLSEKSQPEIKQKLDEINQYVDKIGKPLFVSIQKNQTAKESESNDDDDDDDHDNDIDNDDINNDNNEENILDVIDFKDVDKYIIQKSDYTQGTRPIFKNIYYSIYEGNMKLSKEKVTIMVLDKHHFSEFYFRRFINVLTALKHPNLESFVGYVETPLPHAVVTRRKGETLSTILRRENDNEIEIENENENDINNDENDSENDENDAENDSENDDEMLKKEITLKPGYRTIIAFQIASTMSYLHSMKIAYRDLCTENILIDENLNPRITNFATSRVIPENDDNCMSNMPNLTNKFAAPEINSIEGHSQKIDVFAFSGILYELLTNERPFYDKSNPFEEIKRRRRPELPENISPELKELIESCWKQSPKERPFFAQIVKQMLDKSISFPQDQDSEVLAQFYASKKIKNVDFKICFNLLKKIQEEKDIYVFKEVVKRIRSLLQKYQHVLQSSKYAKQESNENDNVQIKNMNIALENLWLTLQQLSREKWPNIALKTKSFEFPKTFKRLMEEIYICLKTMNFEVPKYEQNDTDLMWDFRFIYPHFEDFCSREADLRRQEISDFMEENDFELITLNKSIKGILSEWKNYEFKRSDFQVKFSPIGKGTSGKVYEGKRKSTGEIVAVKKIPIDSLIEKDKLKFLKREIAVLVQLNNEYLIHFIGLVNEPGQCLWIISELIKGGDLHKANCLDQKLKPYQKTKIAFEIAQAMEYLQSKGIIHRDLKTSNILLDGDIESKDVKVKICDFGMSRIDFAASTTKAGTLNYMAPEVIDGGCYDLKADVFSYGMVLWELYAGEPPFIQYSQEKVEDMIRKNTPLSYPDKHISNDLRDLIEDTTSFDPSRRPSFTEIINRMLNNQIAFYGSNPEEITSFYEKKAQERNK